MTVSIINNLSTKNHGSHIKELILKSDEIIIASPYLLPDFTKFLLDVNWNESRTFHLITTLVPKSEDQIRKIKSLHSLVIHAAKRKISCEVSINNRLHGKVYIFGNEGIYHTAIVSSANMTENGMQNLHEWGICIDDTHVIKQVYDELLSAIEFRNVNHTDILKMYQESKDYLAKKKAPKPAKIPLNLAGLIKGRPAMRLVSGTKYWLKPIGHTHHHVDPNESYHQKTRHLHFSVNEPKEVSIGDILIAFAVGSGKILSVYRVLSTPQFDKSEERWPWYVNGENLTTDFGRDWWHNGLTKEHLKVLYEKTYPGAKIKPKGAQTYGAFNWGWDRLLINKAFGDFIIDQVLAKA